MKIVILPRLVLFFFFFFALSLPFCQHFKILLPSKFIAHLKPSYFATFFAFNFVLIAIFLASFFSYKSSADDLDSVSYLPLQDYEVVEEGKITSSYDDPKNKYNDFAPCFVRVEVQEKRDIHRIFDESDHEMMRIHEDVGSDEDNEYNNGMEDDIVESEDEDEESGHELQRRIEEFIAKNNKVWMEEKLIDQKVLCISRDEYAYTFMQV